MERYRSRFDRIDENKETKDFYDLNGKIKLRQKIQGRSILITFVDLVNETPSYINQSYSFNFRLKIDGHESFEKWYVDNADYNNPKAFVMRVIKDIVKVIENILSGKPINQRNINEFNLKGVLNKYIR